MLPIELTNEEIKNSKAYKEYYNCATREAAPKQKASARRKRSGSDTSITPTAITTPTTTVVVTPRLTATAKGKQPAKAKSPSDPLDTDEGIGSKPGVPDVPSDDLEEEISWNSSDDEDADAQEKNRDDDEGDEKDEKLINEEIGNSKEYKEYHANTTGEAAPKPKASARRTRSGSDTSINPLTITATPRPTAAAAPRLTAAAKGKQTAKAPKAKSLSTPSEPGGSSTDKGTGSKPGVPDVPTDESEEELSWNFTDDEGADDEGKDGNDDEVDERDDDEEGKVDDDDENKDGDAKDDADEYQEVAKHDDKDDTKESGDDDEEDSEDEDDGEEDLNLNISEEERHDEEEEEDELYRDVKEQVKAQASKILPRIEQAVNEQLEAEVLTRSSHSSRTSYVVAVDLSEMELKKILIEKIEGNKSIQRSNEQRNLYKALVDAYDFDKIILDTYGEFVTLKRRRDDDEDKDEEPFAGPDRGVKETQRRSRQASASESAFAEEPVQTTTQIEEPSHPKFETGADDQPIVQSSQHPEWFSQPKKPPSPDRDWNKTLQLSTKAFNRR
nr:hypothetical protein [Tanacetum cinerariifolium]